MSCQRAHLAVRLMVSVKELRQAFLTGGEDQDINPIAQSFLDDLNPFSISDGQGGATSFKPKEPQMRDLPCPLDARLNMTSKFIVGEVLKHLMPKGEDALPVVHRVASSVLSMYEEQLEELEDPPEIMVDTLKACEAVYILADRRLTDADFYRVQALDEAFKNGKAHAQAGVRKLVKETAFWESFYEEVMSNIKEYTTNYPKLHALTLEADEVEPSHPEATEFVERVITTELPVLRPGCRCGATMTLERLCQEKLVQAFAAVKELDLNSGLPAPEKEKLLKVANCAIGCWPRNNELANFRNWTTEAYRASQSTAKVRALAEAYEACFDSNTNAFVQGEFSEIAGLVNDWENVAIDAQQRGRLKALLVKVTNAVVANFPHHDRAAIPSVLKKTVDVFGSENTELCNTFHMVQAAEKLHDAFETLRAFGNPDAVWEKDTEFDTLASAQLRLDTLTEKIGAGVLASLDTQPYTDLATRASSFVSECVDKIMERYATALQSAIVKAKALLPEDGRAWHHELKETATMKTIEKHAVGHFKDGPGMLETTKDALEAAKTKCAGFAQKFSLDGTKNFEDATTLRDRLILMHAEGLLVQLCQSSAYSSSQKKAKAHAIKKMVEAAGQPWSAVFKPLREQAAMLMKKVV